MTEAWQAQHSVAKAAQGPISRPARPSVLSLPLAQSPSTDAKQKPQNNNRHDSKDYWVRQPFPIRLRRMEESLPFRIVGYAGG